MEDVKADIPQTYVWRSGAVRFGKRMVLRGMVRDFQTGQMNAHGLAARLSSARNGSERYKLSITRTPPSTLCSSTISLL
jgi:hypothetical protein